MTGSVISKPLQYPALLVKRSLFPNKIRCIDIVVDSPVHNFCLTVTVSTASSQHSQCGCVVMKPYLEAMVHLHHNTATLALVCFVHANGDADFQGLLTPAPIHT